MPAPAGLRALVPFDSQDLSGALNTLVDIEFLSDPKFTDPFQ